MNNANALCYDYPLRSNFLAQLVLPRDMNSEEAERLCAFLIALAVDFQPDYRTKAGMTQ